MPNLTLIQNSLLTKAEEDYLLYELNDTSFKYPQNKTLIDLFEERVKKTPGSKAIIFDDIELTYDELNSVSNQLADYIKQTYKVKPDDLVGVMLDRGQWLIITILGILKAGAAYVPVDPDYPQERVEYILNDSASKILIDEKELRQFRKSQSKFNKQNQETGLKPENLVYCIYTSGSTGNPKGVLVEHRNVINLLWSQKEVYKITANERVLLFTTVTFDPSAEQIWIAFLSGAALVIINKSTLLDVRALEKYIIAKKVSHIHAVPSYLAELSIQDMSHVKRVITGGESCLPALAQKWSNYCTFINEYGPTETTITSTEYIFPKKDNQHAFIPIGRPTANTQVYFFDEEQRLVPFGEIGELYIGGDGVTRGYLNRPELTAEKFIGNPYKPGDRIYRTGDLGKWLKDGNIEYLGRMDDQVKIRGHRIELDEISAVLHNYPKVNAAIVIARAINGSDKELIAYTTGSAEASELNEHLKKQLPVYMVPAYYVHMESLPLTSNGKIDKRVLPQPTERYRSKQEAFAPPTTDLEKTLADIWNEILNAGQLSINDNFFDLGGSSLEAVRIVNRINSETKATLSLTSLYQLPTIRQLAQKIKTKDNKDLNPILLLKEGKGTPLFIFPPWSSYPTIFNDFVNNFTGDNPLYGIIYTEDSDDFPFKNVQEFVQFVIVHIKELHPAGPYGLLGYSLGARTILEAAIQLQQAGDEVSFLGAISHFPAYPAKRMLFSRRILDEMRVFRHISMGLKFKYLHHRLPYFIKWIIKGKHDAPEIVLEVESQNQIYAIHETYTTNAKFRGDLVLIYETSPDADTSEFRKVQVYRNSIFKKLWSKYVDGEVIAKIMETKHIDFFKIPVVNEVIYIVRAYLK